jgi:hypothetical protein
MIANSELIAVEIVRTLCGSIGLIAAVPVTTALAAAVLRPANRDSEPRDQNDSASENLSLPEKGPDAPASSGLDRPPQWEDFAPDDLF